jgi:hypothetical protein
VNSILFAIFGSKRFVHVYYEMAEELEDISKEYGMHIEFDGIDYGFVRDAAELT